MDAIAVRAHHCEGISCSSSDFSRTSWLWRKSGSVVCQAHPAHPSYKRSQIIYQPSRAHSVFDLQQHDELLREGLNGNSTLYNPSKKSSVLEANEDCYDGVIVNPTGLPADVNEFIDCLRTSLSYWKTQGKRGVWLQLPIHKAEFVPAAIKEGFVYHHAEPTYVMMTYWIPEFPSTLPPNASHQVGIGAFVMNEFREVLAVQEKNGPLRGSGVWKMPTGLINQAEDLCAGAVREVKEETGVDTEFIEVVGFRHGHYVSFNKSDLYFLCALRPLSLEIVSQDGEIEAAKWMPLEEFRAQPFYNEGIARRKMLDLCIASFDGNYEGFKAKWMESGSLLFPSHYFFSK